jgi:putative serine protease PepD
MNEGHEIWRRPTSDENDAPEVRDDSTPRPSAAEETPQPAPESVTNEATPQSAPRTEASETAPLFTIPAARPAAPARRPIARRASGVASFAAVVVLSAALGAGLITGIDALRGDDSGGSSASNGGGTAISTSMTSSAAPDVADVYASVSPSVVEITTTARNGGGLGSGVVVSSDGLILTNNHVIEGAAAITVNFPDGQTAIARVIETKPANDLAVIKVDGVSNLKAVKIGNSSSLRPGDEIIAIGNPLGLDNTVTTGVVSALNRELQGGRGEATLEGLIQIDAAVNSGNSGGGLFNANGELVGIPSAIENPTGQAVFVGVAYAIPINTARADLTSLATL